MRNLLIVGNWKMNKLPSESGTFVRRLSELISSTDAVEVTLAPSFTALQTVSDVIRNARTFRLAAQNLFWEDKGAFTGEISPPMLKDLGCNYVILGHSERRQHFGERDDDVNRKVRAALRGDLLPLFCLGETLEERDRGEAHAVVKRQLAGGLEGISKDEMRRVTVCYEPVWAIGTGRAATVSQAEEIHEVLRRQLIETWGTDVIDPVRILYGGSVTPANAGELLGSPLIDGALVGGACLDADAFATIVNEARRVART